MSKINIVRKHSLNSKSIHKKVQELADKLAEDLAADYSWEEDRLVFKRTGAHGFVRMGKGELEIEVNLGLMFRPLKSTIEKTITDYLDESLG